MTAETGEPLLSALAFAPETETLRPLTSEPTGGPVIVFTGEPLAPSEPAPAPVAPAPAAPAEPAVTSVIDWSTIYTPAVEPGVAVAEWHAPATSKFKKK